MSCTATIPATLAYGARPCQSPADDWKHDIRQHQGACRWPDNTCMYHAYKAPETAPLTIDLTPTEEGFARIAELFIGQLTGSVLRPTAQASREQLASLIETVAYLATKQRGDLIKRLVEAARG